MSRIAIPLVLFLVAAISAWGCGGGGDIEVFPTEGKGGPYALLIITHPSLLDQVEELASFKQESGMSTAVVTTSAIDSDYRGKDLQERIRNCIRHYHENKGVEYVLIAGDQSLVPARYVFAPYMETMTAEMAYEEERESEFEYEEFYVPTDLYYANLDADWDLNDNGYYGEVADLTGLEEDEGSFGFQVAVGRIPARCAEDLGPVVSKIKNYEPREELSALFVSAARDMGERFDDERFTDFLVGKLGSNWNVQSVSEGSDDASAESVLGLLNSGAFNLVAGVTHGTPFGICLASREMRQYLMENPPEAGAVEEHASIHEFFEKALKEWYSNMASPPFLDDEMVANMSNDYPFLFIGFGCYLTAYDYEPHYTFAARMLMQQNGAIAACGLNRVVSDVDRKVFEGALNYEGGMHFELGARILEEVAVEGSSFGKATYRAVEEYYEANGELMEKTDHRKSLLAMTLLGDPTLKLLP